MAKHAPQEILDGLPDSFSGLLYDRIDQIQMGEERMDFVGPVYDRINQIMENEYEQRK